MASTAAAPAAPSTPVLAPVVPSPELLKAEADVKALPEPSTLLEYALRVLSTFHTNDKVALTERASKRWKEGTLPLGDVETCTLPPDRSARPLHLTVVPPAAVPKPQTNDPIGNRLRLIHSLAHIESYAIDLSWDVMLRYVRQGIRGVADFRMPREFFDDWLRVAGEEARHFSTWRDRLIEHGSHYGAIPVHEALWGSAFDTKNDLFARLAIVHMVHEARGLDQSPRMVHQLQSGGDKKSAKLLEEIDKDELTHVGSGMRWFKYVCAHSVPPMEPISTFQATVAAKFRGSLRPPFATEARASIGFTPEWYLPMVHESFRAQIAEDGKKFERKEVDSAAPPPEIARDVSASIAVSETGIPIAVVTVAAAVAAVATVAAAATT